MRAVSSSTAEPRRWFDRRGSDRLRRVDESVNVSVFLYAPARSGSVAPIVCLSVIVTASPAMIVGYVSSVSGLARP